MCRKGGSKRQRRLASSPDGEGRGSPRSEEGGSLAEEAVGADTAAVAPRKDGQDYIYWTN